MWHRLREDTVAVINELDELIELKIYVKGELKEIKTFKTLVQAHTFIALQQRVGTEKPLQNKNKGIKNKQIDLKDLKHVMKHNENNK